VQVASYHTILYSSKLMIPVCEVIASKLVTKTRVTQ
jgi:hypothetical protein